MDRSRWTGLTALGVCGRLRASPRRIGLGLAHRFDRCRFDSQLSYVPGYTTASPPADVDHLGRQLVDEIPIVRHEDQRAAEVLERFEQDVLRVEIEDGWSARRAAACSPGRSSIRATGETRALAARAARAPACSMSSPREQEPAQDVADIRTMWIGASPAERLIYRLRRIELRASSCAKYCMTTGDPSVRVPLSGASVPESIRISVDLPTPLGPMSAMPDRRARCAG
jgi:hypothetical protein